MMIKLSLRLTIACLIGAPLVLLVAKVSGNAHRRISEKVQDLSADASEIAEETIQTIGQALLTTYNANQECFVWGFGAKFGGILRNLFQCGPSPTVLGVPGILQAYESVLSGGLTMSGPTMYTQVIQAAAVKAKRSHDQMSMSNSRAATAATASSCALQYFVLVVMSDGHAEEMEETKRKLAVYSNLPLAIIFVGVGVRSNFAQVKHELEHCGNSAVTFVEFRKHQDEPAALSAAALKELPSHVCRYFNGRTATLNK